MINVIFLNNWGDSPQKCLTRYNFQTPNHDGIWEDIRGVTKLGSADYYIILDGYNKFEELDEHKKVYFQREPPAIVSKHAFDHDKAAYIGSYPNHYHLATWQLKIPFDKLANLKCPDKKKLLSTVTSRKMTTKGQRQRVKVAETVKNIVPAMGFYGRGFKPLNQNGYCKKGGLLPYRYSLACENCQVPNYFTEKIIDCMLCWTKPIYWGCPNIDQYFPKGSYATVDIFHKNAAEMIVEEVKKPVDYDALGQARELILNKYNIWPSALKVIKELQ